MRISSMVGFIYKYENKINHKVYIGQTTDLVNRKSSHKYKATFVKSKFYNAVRKYGWENFEFDIVAQVECKTLKEVTIMLDTLEKEFISKFNSFECGYNSTAGGHSYRGKVVSEEFREYCRNRKYSEDTRRKMSDAAHNKTISDETRKKLKDNAINRNFAKYGEIYKEKRCKKLKEILSKPVVQIDKFGTIVNEFSSEKEAVLFIQTYLAQGKTYSGVLNGIRRHCLGYTKKRYYYGFEWKFLADV